jgi:hypothetical protein
MSQQRQPQGIPTGGQFAAQVHAEADLNLTEAISDARAAGQAAQVRRVEASVMAMANETLRRHPNARFVVADYSDQDYDGRLVPSYLMDGDREEIDDTADLAWCNAAEEYVGELDDSVRDIYERWATDEYLAIGRRERQETAVEFDLDKIAADPALDLPKPSVLDDGTEVWELRDGCKHRIGGPAIVRSDGYEEWDRYGLHHRDDGPAVTWPDGAKLWYQQGKLHRDGAPAVVQVGDDGTPRYEWHRDGRSVPAPTASTAMHLYLSSKPPAAELRDVADQFASGLDRLGRPGDAARVREVAAGGTSEDLAILLDDNNAVADELDGPLRLWR